LPEPAAGDSRRLARRVIVSGMTGYRACQAADTRAAGDPRPPAEFRVLGPSEVIVAGKPVPVISVRATLLHVLLLLSAQPCQQDLPFAALRGDTWPAAAAAALARCAARSVHRPALSRRAGVGRNAAACLPRP